jgi:Flp pilus assembly protein TadD
MACAARSTGPSAATVSAVEKAEAAERRRDHAAALALYRDAIAGATDPASERFARRELADSLIAWGEYEPASVELGKLTVLAPGDPAAWHDLGMVRHKLGDVSGAAAAFRSARAAAPDDARPRIALAAMLWKSGDRAGARAEYEALLGLPLPDRIREKVEWAIAQLSKPPPEPAPQPSLPR